MKSVLILLFTSCLIVLFLNVEAGCRQKKKMTKCPSVAQSVVISKKPSKVSKKPRLGYHFGAPGGKKAVKAPNKVKSAIIRTTKPSAGAKLENVAKKAVKGTTTKKSVVSKIGGKGQKR